jgi:Zn-dependent protease with chaperone function
MATLIPAVALALSLIVAVFSHWRAAHRVQAWLRGNAVGSGPGESVIVVEPEVMLAAAGVRKARVIVSAGALLALDEGELNAGIEHERGHIKRRHSYVSAVARVLYAVARGLPGTSRVQEQLTFYLERDADEYAIKRTGDPLALAAAICKSKQSLPALSSVAFATLAGAGAPRRLRLLLDRNASHPSALISAVGVLLTVSALALTLVLLADLPGLIHGGVIAMAHAPAGPFCPD